MEEQIDEQDNSMDIGFRFLNFKVQDGRITLNGFPFVEAQLAGENKDSHFGSKMVKSSEGWRLRYVSHSLENERLVLRQESELLAVKTVLKGFPNTNAVQIYTEVTNRSESIVTLEEVSAFVWPGIAGGLKDTKNTYLYRFTQSHHGECQPRVADLFGLGLFRNNPVSQKRICGINIGSWSTKEELPQGILAYKDQYLMFQLESNNSWYWEISDFAEALYLYLGGANCQFGGFTKELIPNECYKTNTVAVCMGDSLNGVVGEMTAYRRCIKGYSIPDKTLPSIFNEYMHLSWDSPTEENTRKVAPAVAKTGVSYYVIDCGWHNEEKGSEVYPYVGQWKESHARFPHGLRSTMDYIRSLGMKPGLWIEPEIVGFKCQEMLDFYEDECFLQRHGKKVLTMGRFFLDFRHKKVYAYMSETIRRMVEDYGAEYIKMDYNEDVGIGTDMDCDSFGDGLQQCAAAYLHWIDDMHTRYPHVLFEACSSGGMRMDYETLQHFSIASTSDQTDYRKYPYIAGNVLSAILPEQGAVWSYPVDSYGEPNCEFNPTKEWVEEHISKEQVVMNMINAFLGRMHLASYIELLSEEKQALIREGVSYADSLTSVKKTALPYFPLGFTDFSKDTVAAGLKSGSKLYLAVWNIGGDTHKNIPIDAPIMTARVAYPSYGEEVSFNKGCLSVTLPERYSARFIELELAEN